MNGDTLCYELTVLPPTQARVLAFVEEYYSLTKEGCPAQLAGRRFERSTNTIRSHFEALHRKGWLITDASPATPKKRDIS